MSAALGIGGFPHFAAHPFIWPATLGFRMEEVQFHRLIGARLAAPEMYPCLRQWAWNVTAGC
jgi:hypothetical protein